MLDLIIQVTPMTKNGQRHILISRMVKTSSKPRKTSVFHLPGAFDLFKPSKEIILKNLWIFGPLYAVPLIFGIHDWIWSPGPNQAAHWWSHFYGFHASAASGPFPSYDSAFVGFSIFWVLIVFVLGTIAVVMAQSAQLRAIEGKHLDFEALWRTTKELGLRLFLLYIVTAIIIIFGFILLIVPGLIFARRYFLAPYVMLDQKTGLKETLRRSAELSKKNTGAIWGVIGVIVLIGLIGIVPIIGGLVSFVLSCLYSVAPAMRYQQLKRLA